MRTANPESSTTLLLCREIPMTTNFQIEKFDSLHGYLPELQLLIDTCYPKPPRDVFYRLVDQYRCGFPAWIARADDGRIVGFVHLAPNSKGGTLETLAVHPDYRRLGIAQQLVQRLADATAGVISLTTRIPAFFSALYFEEIRVLPDRSVFMIQTRFPGERAQPKGVSQ